MTSSRKWTQRIVSNCAHFHKKVTLLKCASAMILDLKPKEYRTSTKHEKYATLMVDLQEQPCVDCWKMWFAKEIIHRSDNCKGKDKLYVATKKFLLECSELVVLIESSNCKGKDGLERPRCSFIMFSRFESNHPNCKGKDGSQRPRCSSCGTLQLMAFLQYIFLPQKHTYN